MRATVDKRGGGDEFNLLANEIIPIEEANARFTAGLRINLEEELHGMELINKLQEILRGYPGKMEVLLAVKLASGDTVHLKSRKNQVEISPEMRSRWMTSTGAETHSLLVNPPKVGQAAPPGVQVPEVLLEPQLKFKRRNRTLCCLSPRHQLRSSISVQVNKEISFVGSESSRLMRRVAVLFSVLMTQGNDRCISVASFAV